MMKEKKGCPSLFLIRTLLIVLAVVVTFLSICKVHATDMPEKAVDGEREELRGLAFINETWTGDFDQMLERRIIRVLVPYSRTLYFNDRGQEKGLTGEAVRDFERYLNRKYAKVLQHRPLTVFIIPRPRNRLLDDLTRGLGDIAAGNITVTEERRAQVDFVAPADLPASGEILVMRTTSPPIRSLDDLSGKTVHVRKASSYFESLKALNRRWQEEGKDPVKMVFVSDVLEDEDLLEMLNAGIFEYLIVDGWLAEIWADVLPDIRVRKDIVLRSGGITGWAIRKGSPKLREEIGGFCKTVLDKQRIVADRLAQYHKGIVKIKDPTRTPEWKRFEKTWDLFMKYGNRYRFDPVLLAAMGYQESGLDQKKQSRSGAVGIMQLLPATGKAMQVGDIRESESNIHAAAKYMDQLMTRYFSAAKFNAQGRSLFAIAAYNAGPERILGLCKLAERQGLDPNQWFENVELVAAQKIGSEVITYVRNIYKYFMAYKLALQIMEAKERSRGEVLGEIGGSRP